MRSNFFDQELKRSKFGLYLQSRKRKGVPKKAISSVGSEHSDTIGGVTDQGREKKIRGD
jgi:hypothetical protein